MMRINIFESEKQHGLLYSPRQTIAASKCLEINLKWKEANSAQNDSYIVFKVNQVLSSRQYFQLKLLRPHPDTLFKTFLPLPLGSYQIMFSIRGRNAIVDLMDVILHNGSCFAAFNGKT